MKFNLSELKKAKKQNQKERIEFVRMYAEWLMKNPNKKWSKDHAKFINSVMNSSRAVQRQAKK